MAVKPFLLLLGLTAVQVHAHFRFLYPPWRFDSLSAEAATQGFSQWEYPCAGVPYKTGNVTDWPLDGGSVVLGLNHPWTYLFINLGLGENTTNFNISLTPQLTNTTGKGTLCVEKLALPKDLSVQDGTLATLQVVTSGESGSALYNCADIRLSKDAKTLSNCTNPDHVVVQTVQQQTGGGNQTGGSGGGMNSSPGPKNAAGLVSPDQLALASAMGLAVAFAVGLGW